VQFLAENTSLKELRSWEKGDKKNSDFATKETK